jgi:recombination protein U
MKYKSKHANRGKRLEDLIEFFGYKYQSSNEAYLIKYPPLVKHLRSLKNGQFVAVYSSKGQPDYFLISNGESFLFDAKEFAGNRFPFSSLHAHQFNALNQFENCGGNSALLFHAKSIDAFYVAPFKAFKSLYLDWIKARNKKAPTKKGSASISLEYMAEHFIPWNNEGYLHGLKMIAAENDLPW